MTEELVRDGFAAARWPGRLELLPATSHGRILLDGAHNPAGARALATALDDLGVRGMPLVFGATRGKRVTAMLRELVPLAPIPVFTRIAESSALRVPALLAAWRRAGGGAAHVAEDPAEALATAAALRRDAAHPVVVAGSLYLVGAVRAILLHLEEETG